LRIAILPVGVVNGKVSAEIRRGLMEVFPGSLCQVQEHFLPVPKEAYNPSRRQYVSTRILSEVIRYVETKAGKFHRVLGVADVDLYVPGLNFVFGEAQCPGKAALISLFRLRPEFYGEPADEQLFHERGLKESVHELGHTLGLKHCSDQLCVMHFSLHIGMTDKKGHIFCPTCRFIANETIRKP